MKQLNKSIFLAAMAVTGALTAQAQSKAPVYAEISTGGDFANKGLGSTVYANITFKLNDRYTLTPEIASDLTYRTTNTDEATGVSTTEGTFNHAHKFIRVLLTDTNLATLGEWKLAMAYRYSAPTDLDAQKAGMVGRILLRPAISGKVGPVDLVVRENVSIPLNRNAYQVVAPEGAGNPLITNAIEVLPSYSLTETLGVALALTNTNTLIGAARGTTDTTTSNKFKWDVEVGYSGTAVAGLGVAVGVESESTYKNYKFVTKETGNYYLTLSKTF